ncbi:MAG TPA: response regulator [Pyrinomonadaceae bacterium]
MSPTERRILCIESHADTRTMLTTLLGLLDYQIISAESVTEGVQLARSERFDLYLLGDRYTDGTSIDLCRELRLFDPLTPIIIFSTSTQAAERHQAMIEGAQEYVRKPGDILKLTERISTLVAREESGARA